MFHTVLFKVLTSTSPVDTLNIADSAKVHFERISEALATNPGGVLTDLIEHFIRFGLKVLAALVIYSIGVWLIKKIKHILQHIFERRGTEKAIVTFTNSLVSISLTIILVIITVGTLGVNTTSLAAILAAGGMAIGMALSGTVQNFAGGIMLLVFKPFKVGDYIKALGYEGFVTEVNIVSTRIRTYENSIIVLPNGALSNGNIDNFSHNDYHRVTWNVNVAYGSEPGKVKEVVLEILKSDPRILDSTQAAVPDPSVNLSELKDSSVEFVCRAWTKVSDYWPVQYAINERIYTELPQHGIQFPFPQMDVHLIKN